MMGDSFIIAIDFGTTYSGYSFSLTPRGKDIDPYLKCWGKEFGKETPKTPTCILFDEHGEFMKFGYEAQMAYVRMCAKEARKHFFFENFKMSLYNRKLNRNMTIEAANGKSMNTLKVFTEALRYLTNDALETITANTEGRKFSASDFTWVLTVPAIWDPSAKQFMKEAATQAGIVTDKTEKKLVIALEPEAASVWCKSLPAQGFITENHGGDKLDRSPGTQYIVVDCGGGTIDITVHEVLDGGALKELHKASGNDLGGQTVDKKFKEFLREIFCHGVWDEYERKYPSEVQGMMHEFTVFKRNYDDVQITCSYNLGSLAQRRHRNMEKFFETVEGASWSHGSVKISKEKMRSFFDESLNGITESLREILNKDLSIEFILLVGGYAESEILRQHIISNFGYFKVLCPFRAQEAIVKGAVRLGRNPEVVASRKSAFTYGIKTTERFDESKHRAEKKYTNKNGVWCKDIFKKLVEIDEDVGWNESREYIFPPADKDQKCMGFGFFHTQRKNPLYVDEWGVKKIGSFLVDMPDTTRGMDRQVKLEIKFGFTEMTATATDMETRSTVSIKLDFLAKS
ncbi:heat shock 70 kDa protein 12A-like [Lates calcarifer]|uniref:Heat shock 70 kDa protein 12A-like n=1 Tax=Lates calcarifer TaxID=8187 RepID=A0AAJ7VBL9_LATCA|nr:heat shock 70 kDa protein 12A-like [Lates calcarifer]